ncbi:MAG: hypothetical protein ABIP77_07585 [Candidatus Limnocylindrales bacterium]
MNRNRLLAVLTGLGAGFFLVFGLWSFLEPRSFFDQFAHFEPYNAHFVHDIGAFQVGIGTTLAMALWRRTDAIFAALGGAGVGAAFHVANHIRDTEMGGTDTDTIGLAIIAAVVLLGAAWKGSSDRA